MARNDAVQPVVDGDAVPQHAEHRPGPRPGRSTTSDQRAAASRSCSATPACRPRPIAAGHQRLGDHPDHAEGHADEEGAPLLPAGPEQEPGRGAEVRGARVGERQVTHDDRQYGLGGPRELNRGFARGRRRVAPDGPARIGRWLPRLRHRPGRRLRRAVRPADRPPGARGARLQRDRAAHDAGRGDARAGGRRRSSCPAGPRRSTPTGAPAGGPGAVHRRACRRSASATASRRWRRRSAGRWRAPGSAEFGGTALAVVGADSTLFRGLPREQSVWMSHGDAVSAAPAGFAVVGDERRARRSPRSRTSTRRLAGVQFHPEVMHTEHGQAVLEHFLYEIAGCSADVDHGERHRRAGRR